MRGVFSNANDFNLLLMIFAHTSLHSKLQPWSQALEIVILFAFCPSLPLCNVDITLKSNTSLHYTIFQHLKGEWGCRHSFCRYYGYDYFPAQFFNGCSSSPIPRIRCSISTPLPISRHLQQWKFSYFMYFYAPNEKSESIKDARGSLDCASSNPMIHAKA